MTPLGTDGYGVSDTREALRAHFGVDAPRIALAALALLAETGLVDPEPVEHAVTDTGANDITGMPVGDPARAHRLVA